MAHYVILGQWTDQGIRNVKASPERNAAARKLVEAAGGKIWTWYTMGAYDFVAIADLPDDAAANQVLLKVGTLGNVRTTTLKAWSEPEFAEIVQKL